MSGLTPKSVERWVADLKVGDHVCSVYQDRSELAALVVEFMKAGLAKGFRCCHVADDQTVDEVRQALAAAGVNVGREQRRGALQLLTKQDVYIRDGAFSPANVFEFVRREEAQAVADGCPGFWASGEMTWALGKEPGCDRLGEYEALLDQMAGLHRTVVLCLYNEALFGRPCVHDLERLHSGGVLRPATEPGQPAEAAGDREELYRFLMENTHDVVSLYETDGRRVCVSPAARRLLGWVPDQRFAGLHPDDLPAVRDRWQRILAGEKVVVTVRQAHADGSWRWLESSGSLVQFRGRPHVLAVTRDVTDRKAAEEALREREELLRLLTENTVEFIRFFDPDGKLVYANPAVERLLGNVPDDFGGFHHPDDVEPALRWFERVRAGSHESQQWRVRTRDGEWRWMETWGTVVHYLRRRYVLTICHDVTAKRQAEEALRASEQKLKEAERIAHVGYWEGDIPTGRITWSDELYRTLGLRPQERVFTLDEFRQLVHPEDRELHDRAVADSQLGVRRYDVEFRVVRPDGQIRFIHSQGDITRDASGRPVRAFGIAQDITDRKRTEEALRESAERLQHLSRRLLAVQEEERRHIARELHDEFGQLLACATLHLHAARGAAGEAARPRLDECVSILRRAGEQVRGLALRLRPTMLETAGLDGALRWLAEQHQRQTGVVTHVAGHVDGVSGDLAIACFRVVQEALTNVVRHAKARHVWLELSRGEGLVRLVVRDDGVGFDVARTLEEAAAHGRLGLLGMRERVQILGGSLAVESEPGHGTRVRVSFPLTESAE